MESKVQIEWTVRSLERPACSIAEFRLLVEPLHPQHLVTIQLPTEVRDATDRGIAFSGKGPIWLYAHLTHLAHHFAWVATYEPRHKSFVVVQRHRADAPEIGSLVATGSL